MMTHATGANTFRQTRFRPGYATEEVDLFVADVEDACNPIGPGWAPSTWPTIRPWRP
jgi:DivIVA domain-containing protein